MWVFTTNNDVDSENVGLHDPASTIFSISTIISWWVKLGISIAQILIITHVWYLPLDIYFQCKQGW